MRIDADRCESLDAAPIGRPRLLDAHRRRAQAPTCGDGVFAGGGAQAPQRGRAGVSYVRCRQVSKPAGAKPGLVRLSGEVGTVKLDVSAEGTRLERLEATLLPVNSAPL